MSGWTPGRWQRLGDSVNSGYGIICTNVSGRGADELLANAHLIAAAPDLYEALEFAVEVMEDGHQSNAKAQARAALAKARGESNE